MRASAAARASRSTSSRPAAAARERASAPRTARPRWREASVTALARGWAAGGWPGSAPGPYAGGAGEVAGLVVVVTVVAPPEPTLTEPLIAEPWTVQ